MWFSGLSGFCYTDMHMLVWQLRLGPLSHGRSMQNTCRSCGQFLVPVSFLLDAYDLNLHRYTAVWYHFSTFLIYNIQLDLNGTGKNLGGWITISDTVHALRTAALPKDVYKRLKLYINLDDL